jgi:hypothetical protein
LSTANELGRGPRLRGSEGCILAGDFTGEVIRGATCQPIQRKKNRYGGKGVHGLSAFFRESSIRLTYAWTAVANVAITVLTSPSFSGWSFMYAYS